MRIAFHTFGCKLNQSESEALASEFRNQGFLIVRPDQPADIIIINTCTVTSKSEQKARRVIRKYLADQPDSLVIATGCYAQLRRGELQEISKRLFILPHDQKDILLDLPAVIFENTTSEQIKQEILKLQENTPLQEAGSGLSRFRFRTSDYSFHTRPFLKIQDGCDNSCAYCTVPLARGTAVSLVKEEVIAQVVELEKKNHKEVVLTGVNISMYNTGGTDLPDLLSEIVAATKAIRIRLSSIEPDGVTEKLCRVAGSSRFCSHFHLPIQSGSKSVLQLMKRKYLPEQAAVAAKMLKEIKEDPFIAGDVIVGFPGEREDDFEATKSFVEHLGFSRLHVFQFSSRPGTGAETMKNKVPERIAKERSKQMTGLSDRLYGRYISRWTGKKVEVLAEGPAGGITDNYLKVTLHPASGTPLVPGELYEGILSVDTDNRCWVTVT